MAAASELPLLSETELEQRAPANSPVTCPTLDLAATWDAGGRNLFICRPPGQVVSKIHQVGAPGQKAPEALVVTWKPDGQFLAVGWSDGVVRLMGLENNKAAHHIHVCEPAESRITHIGWSSSNIADKKPPPLPKELDQVLPDSGLSKGDGAAVDLPREVTFLEVDTALPKISPLPSGSAGAGEDAMVFTLRSGIEFLFQPPRPEEYDQVNAMIVGTADGRLHLSIYDSFAIGTFQGPSFDQPGTPHLINHASHPAISTHSLVLSEKATEPEAVHLVPMDLPFISSSSINLSLLASKLTTLQKLLRYLNQTQLHMQVEWKNARELPGRFLRSVEGDLGNMTSGPREIVPALYHAVVTGHAHEPVREWLVESLAERGHKRWDKAVVSGLEGLRSLVHENFLPALDRCSIILSRLRGLAQFYDTRDDIGFSITQISRIMDIIGCLTLVGHKVLILVMDELEHFTAFSAWLRFHIDRLASSASAGEELTEKEATMDNAKILTYIERFLTRSPLDVFFDQVAKEDYAADWQHIDDGPSLLDVLDRQLKRREEGQASMKALPHVDFLVKYMTTRSEKIFRDIAEAKKRSVRFGRPMKICTGRPIAKMDVRMCENGDKGGTVYIAVASKEATNEVHIFRADIDIVNGISSNQPVTACRIDLRDRKLIDLKYLNYTTLILVCAEPDNTPVVLSVPVHAQSLSYGTYDSGSPADVPHMSTNGFSEYRFPAGQPVRPVRVEVHDRADVRGELRARISLLDSNRTTLRTFSIPA